MSTLVYIALAVLCVAFIAEGTRRAVNRIIESRREGPSRSPIERSNHE